MATRDELVAAVAERYARSDRVERGRILDGFVAVTGHHRKHAMRLSNDIRNPAAGDTGNPATAVILMPRPEPVRCCWT